MSPLTVVECAAIIRVCRVAREQMKIDLCHLLLQAKLGDRVADGASVTLNSEITLLEAGIRKLWLMQPGVVGPPPW